MRLAIAVCTALLLMGAGVTSASAGEPIKPDQHFIGLVNGSNAVTVVHTVCPGPEQRVGPVAANQNLGVARVSGGHGYTGPLSSLYAWFVPRVRKNGPLEVRFAEYGTHKAVPSGVRVPCAGTGRVEFSSCPYLAPCVTGWVPTYVRVHFVNIAALNRIVGGYSRQAAIPPWRGEPRSRSPGPASWQAPR